VGLSSEDVLFVSRGSGVVAWYRCGAPAFYLGCDWIGLEGRPPNLTLVTSLKRGGHQPPDLASYKIIVLQQVQGSEWLKEIKQLQARGICVLYEVDDYLHGVHKIPSHRAKEAFSAKRLREYELCMYACDGLIVSTEWLAKHYRRFNSHVYVCCNGIEARRYRDLRLPERKSLNIGWAGGEGHLEAVTRWLPAVGKILDEFPHTRFLSMGLTVASQLKRPKQAACLPFISIENFPAALTNFDLAIAPAGRGNFYAAKSDLRFLETGALGIPLVADPFVYGTSIEHGVTGLLADTSEQVETDLRRLIVNVEERQRISRAAREYVLSERSIENEVSQWENAFTDVYDRVREQRKPVQKAR
jgi:glycosyltransferase involved in cell wall biosynthesis